MDAIVIQTPIIMLLYYKIYTVLVLGCMSFANLCIVEMVLFFSNTHTTFKWFFPELCWLPLQNNHNKEHTNSIINKL